MWVGDWSSFADDVPKLISCKNHKHTIQNSASSINAEDPGLMIDIAMQPEFQQQLLHRGDLLQVHLMDPFLFGVPYGLDRLSYWAFQAGLLPKRGVISDGTVDENTRNIILLMNTASYHMVHLHMAIWTFKPKCSTLQIILEEQVMQFNDLESCKELDDAIKCMERNMFFAYFSTKLTSEKTITKRMAGAAFVISYYYLLHNADGDDSWDNFIVEVETHYTKREEPNQLKETGNEEFKQQQYMQAIASYTKAIKEWPYNPYLYGNRAQCFLKLHKWSDAEIDCYRAIVLKSRWCKGYYRLSQAVYEQGRCQCAYHIAKYGMQRCHDTCSCPELPDLVQYCAQLESKAIISSFKHEIKKKKSKSSKQNAPQGPKKASPTKNEKLNAKNEDVPELVSDSTSGASDDEVLLPAPASKKDISSAARPPIIPQKKTAETLFYKTPKNFDKVFSIKDLCKFSEAASKNTNNKANAKDISPNEFVSNHNHICNVEVEVKKGSEALLSGRPRQAADHFQKVLTSIAEGSLKTFPFKNDDIVVLQYSLGIAFIEIGLFEELQKALSTFGLIITEHRNVRFPAVYYGIGRAYMKLNRYSEALSELKKGLSIVEKNIAHAVYTWPGTTVLIEETKSAYLQEQLGKLILSCKYPPAPNAVCVYHACSLLKEIRYSDPDFKGFITLVCSDHCRIHYHPSCWKLLKNEMVLQEKEIVAKTCFTPDCTGIITCIVIKDKDGNSSKEWHHEKAQKSVKDKHRKSRLEKKMAQRLLHKTQRKSKTRARSVSLASDDESNSDDNEPESKNEQDTTASKENCVPKDNLEPPHEITQRRKMNDTARAPVVTDGKAMFVLNKNKETEEYPNIKNKSNRNKEKKAPRGKKIMTVDEFCGDLETYTAYNSYLSRMSELREKKEIAMSDVKPEFSDGHFPNYGINSFEESSTFLLSQDLRNDKAALEACFKSYNLLDQEVMLGPVEEEVFHQVQDFLSANGPISEDNELWTDIAGSFSMEAQHLISEHGGLIPFLLQSVRFTKVHNYICLSFDMVTAYNMFSATQNSVPWSAADDLCLTTIFGDPLFDIPVDHKTGLDNCDKSLVASYSPDENSFLNPDAPEYQPPIMLPDTSKEIKKDQHSQSSRVKSEETLFDGEQIPVMRTSSCHLFANVDKFVEDFVEPIKKSPTESIAASDDSFDAAIVTNSKLNAKNETIFQPKSASQFVAENAILLENHHTNAKNDASTTTEDKEKTFDEMSEIMEPVLETMIALDKKRSLNLLKRVFKSQSVVLWEKPINKTIQVGSPEVSRQSVMVQVDDHRLEMSENEKANLEERLQETLDSLTQLQKKVSIEIPLLQKQVEEAKDENEKLQLQFDQEKEVLTKDRKKLQQEKKKLADDLKSVQQKLNAVNFQKDMLDQKVKELTSQLQEMQIKQETQQQSNDQVMLSSLWESCEEANKRAKKAELELLGLKKSETVNKINALLENARKKLTELDQQKWTNVGQVQFPLNHNEWINYIEVLNKSLQSFIAAADSQILAVQEGRPLSVLGPFPTTVLPAPPKTLAIPPQNHQVSPLFMRPYFSNVPVNSFLGASASTSAAAAAPAVSAAPQPSSSITSTEAPQPSKASKSGSQEKLIHILKNHFPNLTDDQLRNYVYQVRAQNNNTLSRMSFQSIISQVTDLIASDKKEIGAPVAVKTRRMNRKTITSTNKPNDPKRSSTGLDRIDSTVKCPWAVVRASAVNSWSNDDISEKTCSICLEELELGSLRKLECGHSYHKECIRNWTKRERTCPICRVLILCEEFPSLD